MVLIMIARHLSAITITKNYTAYLGPHSEVKIMGVEREGKSTYAWGAAFIGIKNKGLQFYGLTLH